VIHLDALDPVVFVKPDKVLGRRLLPVARRIFTDTFGARYDPSEFAAFCDAVYRPGGSMERDLAAPDIHWKVALYRGDPIGYAKLTPLRAPAIDAAPEAMELQQLYVLADWHGSGVAETLMQWALAKAAEHEASELYLTVFDHNERAKRFYARHGFADVGHCTFRIGDRIDEDRIWRRRLGAGAGLPAAGAQEIENDGDGYCRANRTP